MFLLKSLLPVPPGSDRFSGHRLLERGLNPNKGTWNSVHWMESPLVFSSIGMSGHLDFCNQDFQKKIDIWNKQQFFSQKSTVHDTNSGHLAGFFLNDESVEVLWRLVQSDMIMHSLHQEWGTSIFGGEDSVNCHLCSFMKVMFGTTRNQMLFMWFLYTTNHLRIMAVWNEAQGA